MRDHLSLVRKSQTIITYLNHHLLQDGSNDIRYLFTMMKTLQHIFPQWVLLSCPGQHPGVFFITDNCKDILGYTTEELAHVHHPTFLVSRIHEDDVDDMHRCFSFIESFLKETMPYEYTNLRFVLQYRFRHKRGHYMTIHQEQAILPLEDADPLYYSIIKDCGDETVFNGVQLEVYKHDASLKKVAEFYPAGENQRLSKREKDIIGLMQTGLSTKEIAHKLSISQHTARNIKQKMFEKYKVNNSISLLNKAVYRIAN